jgi:hypothetical protein
MRILGRLWDYTICFRLPAPSDQLSCSSRGARVHYGMIGEKGNGDGAVIWGNITGLATLVWLCLNLM